MALKLYRRHRKECEGDHAEDTRSGEFEEGRRGWKKCGCLIHASGSLRGAFKRKNTGRTDWHEAKAIALELEKTHSWDGEVVIPPVVPEQSSLSKRTNIERAANTFLEDFGE